MCLNDGYFNCFDIISGNSRPKKCTSNGINGVMRCSGYMKVDERNNIIIKKLHNTHDNDNQ